MSDRPDTHEYFIGLKKTASTPTAPDYWLDGSNSTFRAYEPGEPNGDVSCFIIQIDGDLEMEDEDCDKSRKYICKITNGKIIIIFQSSI